MQKINRRKLNTYKMQLAIAQNPHVKDPQILWKAIEKQEADAGGYKSSGADFDPAGFELLKSRLSDNPRIVVKS